MSKLLIGLLVFLFILSGCSTADIGMDDNQTWISPGKVEVGNYYPGAIADYPLTLHNGENKSQTFIVGYRKATRVKEGYSFPPDIASEWVKISDTSPTLAPGETKEITISLAVPKDMETPKQWEIWVSATGETKNMINIELVSRIQITMR